MSIIAFLVAAFILAVTPGPGIAYVVARTTSGGRPVGLASCLGTGFGGLVHVGASALGLSVLIARSATAFSVLRFLGTAYLLYLGIRTLLRKEADHSTATTEKQGIGKAFVEGTFVEVFNVKTALFFVAFLPQFIDPAQAIASQLAILGTISVTLNTAVDVLAVYVAHGLLRSGIVHAGRARTMNRISGWTMVGLSGLLALSKRHQ